MKKINEYSIKVLQGSIKGALTNVIFNLNASLQERMDEIAEIFKRGGAEVVEREPDDDDENDE